MIPFAAWEIVGCEKKGEEITKNSPMIYRIRNFNEHGVLADISEVTINVPYPQYSYCETGVALIPVVRRPFVLDPRRSRNLAVIRMWTNAYIGLP